MKSQPVRARRQVRLRQVRRDAQRVPDRAAARRHQPVDGPFRVDGLQRNQGLELNDLRRAVAGLPAARRHHLARRRAVNTASALTNGKKAPGVPDVQLNLGVEWDASFLRGLTFSGRLIYTSMQYLDPANTQSIPAGRASMPASATSSSGGRQADRAPLHRRERVRRRTTGPRPSSTYGLVDRRAAHIPSVGRHAFLTTSRAGVILASAPVSSIAPP